MEVFDQGKRRIKEKKRNEMSQIGVTFVFFS